MIENIIQTFKDEVDRLRLSNSYNYDTIEVKISQTMIESYESIIASLNAQLLE